jgi:hypothetical protein
MPRPTIPERVVENKIRRVLARRGFTLVKGRRRDPGAVDFGKFAVGVTEPDGILLVAGIDDLGRPAWSREEIDRRLGEFTAERRAALIAAARCGNPAASTR